MQNFQEQLIKAYKQYKDSPIYRTIVDIRRHRAKEIQLLINSTSLMTIKIFNEEIWPIERKTIINGTEEIKVTDLLSMDERTLQHVRDALSQGRLELHGNYTWGSAAKIYGTQSKDHSKKAKALTGAVQILRNTTLSPLEKASQLTHEVFGFGPNIATGLVMLCYPEEFALCNTVSREAMVALGYHIGHGEMDYGIFMKATSDLRKTVNALDYLELDFFLYLIKERTIPLHLTWWVNQGNSYESDKNNRVLSTSLYDARGNTPFHWRTIHDLRPGDLLFHYTKSSLTAVSHVESKPDIIRDPLDTQDQRSAIVQVQTTPYCEIDPPQALDIITPDLRLSEWHGAFNNRGNVNTGYLFPVTPQLALIPNQALIKAMADLKALGTPLEFSTPIVPLPIKPTLSDLAEVTFLDEDELQEIEYMLRAKQQIILEGPPGVGKTFVAELFARYLTGNPLQGESNDQVRLVQFHQSYSYEDFVQGIRPTTNPEGTLNYCLQDGIFKRLCEDARKNPNKEYMLIIDEINRGNIARIFGELLLLLEYRDDGEGHAKSVLLPYASSDDGPFSIPGNIYIIGTMNTADRSLAQIDYALRRRFAFFRMMPVSDGNAQVFQQWLGSQEQITEPRRKYLQSIFIALNEGIQKRLGGDYQIGHSYFMKADLKTNEGLNRLWRHSINPLLEEYFYNQRNRSEILAEFQIDRLIKQSGDQAQ